MNNRSLYATYFDDIFPLNADTLRFLLEYFAKGKTLDLGCATGEYSLALSRKGYDTLGIDIEQDMVDISLEKAKKFSLLSRFLKGNALDVVYTNQYTNVFCIGNTIAHLNSNQGIKQSLQHVKDSLMDGGTLIIQTINYDRILANKVESLPTIENHGVTFVRKYVLDGEHIHFVTTLTKGKELEESDQLLYPILSDELIQILKDLDFKIQATFGSFAKAKYVKEKSYHLVIVAKK